MAHPDLNLDPNIEWKNSAAGVKYRNEFGATLHYITNHYGSTDKTWSRKRTQREGDKTHSGGGRGRDHQGRGGGGHGRGGQGRGRGGGRGTYGTFNTYGDKGKDQGGNKSKQTQVIWANASLAAPDLTVYTIPATIYTLQDNSGQESKHIQARVLFDSGAITRDLVSLKTATRGPINCLSVTRLVYKPFKIKYHIFY